MVGGAEDLIIWSAGQCDLSLFSCLSSWKLGTRRCLLSLLSLYSFLPFFTFVPTGLPRQPSQLPTRLFHLSFYLDAAAGLRSARDPYRNNEIDDSPVFGQSSIENKPSTKMVRRITLQNV